MRRINLLLAIASAVVMSCGLLVNDRGLPPDRSNDGGARVSSSDTGVDAPMLDDASMGSPDAEDGAPPLDAPPDCLGTLCSDGGSPICCGPGEACRDGGGCALPSTISDAGASTLALWLTADQGLSCSGGTATAWADQSAYLRDGAPRVVDAVTKAPGSDGGPIGPHTGPACNVPGHTLNGIPVPYFDAPDDGLPYVDGTLDVDLSFLAEKPFTIFIVERRWAALPTNQTATPTDFLLGTVAPSSTPEDSALQIGYVTYPGCLSIDLDLTHFGVQNSIPQVPSTPPAPASIDTFRTDGITLNVWINGVLLALAWSDMTHGTLSSTYKTSLALGSIGRAYSNTFVDFRYNGDIAEVLIFTSGLDTRDREAVEAYLQAHWRGSFPRLTDGGVCP